MKKFMWIITAVLLAGTAAVLQFLPETVPVHYNAAGEIDRWGSRYEYLLLPLLTIALMLFMSILIRYYEKKAGGTADEKERAGSLSNARVLGITGVSLSVLFMALQAYFIYGAWKALQSGASSATLDPAKVVCILLGILMIFLGNITPKTRRNSVVGMRLPWTQYNDNTWRKSNRFGAYAMMAAGLAAIIAAVLLKSGIAAVAATLALLCLAAAVSAVYAHKVYVEELKLENTGGNRDDQ